MLSTKLGAETLNFGSSTWSLSDSHVGSNGTVMVSSHWGGSSLFLWDALGNRKAEIRSKGHIFTPFIGKAGRILFVERTKGSDFNFTLYEASVTSDNVEVTVLRHSYNYMGFPISIRNSVDESVAIISGVYIDDSKGNPVPDRRIEFIGNNGKHYNSNHGFNSIGRLCQVGSHEFVAVSGLNQKSPTVDPEKFGSTTLSTFGEYIFSISTVSGRILFKQYPMKLWSRGTLLGAGTSEINGKFPISSVKFPDLGGRQIIISCVDFDSGETNLDFALPAGADIGPPTILLSSKSSAEIAFLASESSSGDKSPVEVWRVDLVNRQLIRIPLEVGGEVSSLTREL